MLLQLLTAGQNQTKQRLESLAAFHAVKPLLHLSCLILVLLAWAGFATTWCQPCIPVQSQREKSTESERLQTARVWLGKHESPSAPATPSPGAGSPAGKMLQLFLQHFSVMLQGRTQA